MGKKTEFQKWFDKLIPKKVTHKKWGLCWEIAGLYYDYDNFDVEKAKGDLNESYRKPMRLAFEAGKFAGKMSANYVGAFKEGQASARTPPARKRTGFRARSVKKNDSGFSEKQETDVKVDE